MKKTLTAVALLFFLLSLQGQPGNPPLTAEEMAEEKTAFVSGKLGLDEKQHKQVYRLYLAQSRNMLSSVQGEMRGPGGISGRPEGMRGGPGGPGGMRGGGPGGRPPQTGEGMPERPPRTGAPKPYEESEKNVKKREKKMKKILTPEQFESWTELEREIEYRRFRESFMNIEPEKEK